MATQSWRLDRKRTVSMVALACLASCSEPEGPSLDALPDGATVQPEGKTDGLPQLAHITATTVANLVYPEVAAEGEALWEPEQLEEIFTDRIEPGSSAGAPWNALRKVGPLGYLGPLGPYGPLGVFGPVGNNVWNPSLLISGSLPWDDFATFLTESGGPLSELGPLGPSGPLATDGWRQFEAAWAQAQGGNINAVHLRPGGMFAVLGQTGPLGALGPLGPLGPIGAHGFVRDAEGAYQPQGLTCSNAPADQVDPPCRALELDHGGETRIWDLVEFYAEQDATASPDNDSSFMVQGSMLPGDAPDAFRFNSPVDQWVTVLVVPEFAKFPPFQAIFDVPDVQGSGMCVAEDIPSGGGDPCVPGALLFQLQDRQCLDRAADSLAGVLADVAAQTEESDDLEQWAEAWTTLSGADPFAGCGARIPDKVYIRHALYPWRVSAEFARFNPFVCNALTFFSNPFCRATGLRDVYEVEYDHRSAYDDFDLRLDVAGDGFGGTIVSDSGDTIDWVHVKVPAQTEFTAHVELARTWNVTEDDQRWGLDLFIESGEWANVFSGSDIEFFGSGAERRPVPRYRLIVIGGTEHTRATDVTFGGSYVREL